MEIEENLDSDKVDEVIKYYGRLQLKEQLQLIHQEKKKYSRTKRSIYGVVLLFFILVFSFLAYKLLLDKEENIKDLPLAELDSIYSSYFEPYPIQINRSTISSDSIILRAFQKYAAGAYQESQLYFDSLDLKNSSTKLYYSNALLVNGQFEKALPILQDLAQSQIYSSEGKWYLALVLIKLNQIEKAKLYLDALSNDNGTYTEKANALKDLLERGG